MTVRYIDLLTGLNHPHVGKMQRVCSTSDGLRFIDLDESTGKISLTPIKGVENVDWVYSSVTIKSIIDTVNEKLANGSSTHQGISDKCCEDLKIDTYYVKTNDTIPFWEWLEKEVTIVYASTWVCTDTTVGTGIVYYQGKPFAFYSLTARKNDSRTIIFNKDIYDDMYGHFLRTYYEDPDPVETGSVDMNIISYL